MQKGASTFHSDAFHISGRGLSEYFVKHFIEMRLAHLRCTGKLRNGISCIRRLRYLMDGADHRILDSGLY
ncbi:hypothetical protein D3C85_1878690 [compost metagenome]